MSFVKDKLKLEKGDVVSVYNHNGNCLVRDAEIIQFPEEVNEYKWIFKSCIKYCSGERKYVFTFVDDRNCSLYFNYVVSQ